MRRTASDCDVSASLTSVSSACDRIAFNKLGVACLTMCEWMVCSVTRWDATHDDDDDAGGVRSDDRSAATSTEEEGEGEGEGGWAPKQSK